MTDLLLFWLVPGIIGTIALTFSFYLDSKPGEVDSIRDATNEDILAMLGLAAIASALGLLTFVVGLTLLLVSSVKWFFNKPSVKEWLQKKPLSKN